MKEGYSKLEAAKTGVGAIIITADTAAAAMLPSSPRLLSFIVVVQSKTNE